MDDIQLEVKTLVQLLEARAQNQPDDLAFTFLQDGEKEGGSLTYKELDERAKSIAAKLQSLNLHNERALLIYNSDLEYISSFFGCLYAGVISVPLHPPGKNKSASRISAIAKDSGAKIILSRKEIENELKNEFSQDPVLKELPWIDSDEIKDDLADEWTDPEVTENTLAYLQYTSGSTGTPKGVMVNHKNLITNLEIIDKCHPHTDESVMVTWLPIFHDMGLIYGILLPFYGGYPCYFMTPQAFVQKPFRWLDAISRYKGTHNAAPNFAFELCVNKISSEQKKSLDLSKWTVAMNAAEPVRAETMERFADYFKDCGFELGHFSPGYGLAEGTLILSTTFKNEAPVIERFDDHQLEKNNKAVPAKTTDNKSKKHVGHSNSIEDTRIAIVNPQTLIECKEGEVGEVWASGISIAQGYWQREDATKETFKAHISDTGEGPFLRTGDLGFIKNNELYITGRHKDLIIIRGQNHYPQDIEYTVEASHPALRLGCVAAFSVESEGEEHLGIVQEIQKNFVNEFDIDEVIKSIRKSVSEEHDLQVYSVTLIHPGTVPKTSSGKIQRKACHEGFLEGQLEVIGEWIQGNTRDLRKENVPQPAEKPFVSDQGNLKQWLINRLSELMQINKESIDTNESFAAYGMDSLKAVQLSGDLETLLNRSLPATLVYDYPNINSLSNYLTADYAKNKDTKINLETAGELKSELKKQDEEKLIAITGIGLRFPGANNPGEFWDMLKSGRDAIREVPEERWNKNLLNKSTVTFGGFIDKVDMFDPAFFGISPREAVQIDPQQRLTLEVAWEALEDAGVNPDSLTGKDVGVFMGVCTYDYARFSAGRKELFDVYTGTGTSLSIVANRISYVFDFRGPSVAIDTACSSSLVALHQACESLQSNQCSVALAGGVNLLLAPDWNIVFTEADMLAPDGKCKTFDSAADGYVRSEGCGVVVLKKLSDALKDNDRIYAIVRGSAVNQDGKSNGLTAPNGPSQEDVIRKALVNAGISPAEISYVETHGTGTPLGDPIEVNSLKAVLNNDRAEDNPLWIGSVKTNIGHLEAAAGVAGLIKTSLALFNKEIPPHLNFKNLNPEILIEDTPVKVVKDKVQWENKSKFAGISSFGFGGTNAHVILQEAPSTKQAATSRQKPFNIFTLSAKSDSALKDLAGRYVEFLNSSSLKPEDVCYSANTGRAAHNHRVAIVCSSIEDLRNDLNNFIKGKNTFNINKGAVKLNQTPKVAFLFPGQGAQYIGMGKELYDTHPLFRKIINQCDEILREYLEKPLLEVLFYEKDENINPINDTVYTQPALFAVEYALAKLWMSWGITPAVMMGHSAGEYVAACLAGVFSLEDGLKLVTERGRLMQNLTDDGEMYTIFADEETVKKSINGFENEVSIASINGPMKTVISGSKNAIGKIVSSFEKKQIELKKINVSIASHSPLMRTMIDDYKKICNTVEYSLPDIPVVSNITGEVVSNKIANSQYWCDHIMSTVRFSDGIKACVNYGCTYFIDLGPKPTSIGMGQETVPDPKITWLASIKKNFTTWETMLQGLGILFVNGAEVNWENFDKDFSHKKITLPNYTFQRQRYWIDDASRSKPGRSAASHTGAIDHPLAGNKLISASEKEFIFNSEISIDTLPYLRDHRVFEKVVLPGASYVEIALYAFDKITDVKSMEVLDLKMHKALVLDSDEVKNIQTILTKEEKNKFTFEIFSLNDFDNDENASWILHASGKISEHKYEDQSNEKSLENLKSEFHEKLAPQELYEKINEMGITYGRDFRAIRELYSQTNKALGFIKIENELTDDRYKIHPVLLDACFQTALALLMDKSSGEAFIPVGIGEIQLNLQIPGEVWVLTKSNSKEISSKIHSFDFDLILGDGSTAARIKDFQLKEVSKDEFIRTDDEINNWFYEVEWKKQSDPSQDIIFSAQELSEQISSAMPSIIEEENLYGYKKNINRLEELSILYIIKALGKLGLKFEAGKVFNKNKSFKELGIIDKYEMLFSRMLEVLEKNKFIKRTGDEYTILKDPGFEDITDKLNLLSKGNPELSAETTLVARAGESLGDVLEGKQDPLQLLFPEGDFTTATQLYENSPGFAAMNISIQRIIDKVVKDLPHDKKLRILEIGAGTGSTTASILPILQSINAAYTFTDISPSFFARAKQKFNKYSFLEFKVLDIEIDPAEQGFENNNYDIVIASNVVHATKDLSESFNNILRLLKPSGLLILNEVTEKQNWIDLTFGLTEGWWRFRDFALRPSYPLLSKDEWKKFLQAKGFESVSIQTPSDKSGESFTGQSTIIALAPEKVEANQSGKNLIIFTNKKVFKEFSKNSKSFGTATIVLFDDVFEKISGNLFKINSSDKADYTKVLKVLSETAGKKVSIIYYNPETNLNPDKVDNIEKLSEAGCLNLLNIVQSIGRSQFDHSPDIYIVTRDAQHVTNGDKLSGLSQSSLWGMGKVISMEHPELNCRCIDLDSEDLTSLIRGINSGDTQENQIAYRNNDRYVARLNKSFSHKSKTPGINENSTYLITGGTGGLGILTAEWLVEQGAKHLMLVARSDSTETTLKYVRESKEKDVDIKVVKADVTNKEDLKKLIKDIKKSQFPLKGIIHSAGVLDDGILMNQTKEKFDKVMAPKILGAWYLHKLSEKLNLDFFVMYSSVASLLGSAGQANHSAANSFLDGLAHYRQSRGLPALSINWGVWSDVGSAAALGADKQEKISGIKTINPEQGIRSLEKAMALETAQIGIVPIDWKRFSESYNYPFVSRLINNSGYKKDLVHEEQVEMDLITQFKNSSDGKASELLTKYFQNLISSIMGMEPGDLDIEQPLNTMGLDSLMAIELKNKVNIELGVDLNLVRYMEETNIKQLAEELREQILKNIGRDKSSDSTSLNPEDAVKVDELNEVPLDLDNLSEEEIDRLINLNSK